MAVGGALQEVEQDPVFIVFADLMRSFRVCLQGMDPRQQIGLAMKMMAIMRPSAPVTSSM